MGRGWYPISSSLNLVESRCRPTSRRDPEIPGRPRNPVRKSANFSSSAAPPRGDVTIIFGRNRRLHQPCAPFTLSLSYCTVMAYNDTESPVDSTVSESIEKRLISGIPQVSPVTPLGIAILRKLPDLGTFDDLRCCRVSLPIMRDRTYIQSVIINIKN